MTSMQRSSFEEVLAISQSLEDISLDMSDSDLTFESDFDSDTDSIADESTDSPKEPTEMSPGERVFAIPELFESILMEYVAKHAEIRETNQLLESPVRGLYAYQRINKTCRDVILNSKKLRRLMFIDPPHPESAEAKYLHSGSLDAELDVLQPLWWLLRTFDTHGPRDCSEFLELRRQVWFRDLEISHPDHGTAVTSTRTIRELSNKILRTGMTAMRREKASWRRIKIFRLGPCEPVTINQVFRFPGCKEWYRVEFTVVDGTTLGEFWDWYQKACVLSYYDHVKAMRGLMVKGDASRRWWGR